VTEWYELYKWHLFIGLEVFFWLGLVGFMVLKYWFQTNLSRIFAIILSVSLLFYILLGVIDYVATKHISNFQIIIAVFFIYTIFYGKKDFQRIDDYVKGKVANLKGQTF